MHYSFIHLLSIVLLSFPLAFICLSLSCWLSSPMDRGDEPMNKDPRREMSVAERIIEKISNWVFSFGNHHGWSICRDLTATSSRLRVYIFEEERNDEIRFQIISIDHLCHRHYSFSSSFQIDQRKSHGENVELLDYLIFISNHSSF